MIMKNVVKAREAQLKSRKEFDEERKKASTTKRTAAYEELRKTVIATQENVEVTVVFLLIFSRHSLKIIRNFQILYPRIMSVSKI